MTWIFDRRLEGIVIECHAAGISLEPDHDKSIIASSPTNELEREVRIPRQRSRQQKKRGITDTRTTQLTELRVKH